MEQAAVARGEGASGDPAQLLVASRRLLVLDELRVPYACSAPEESQTPWQSLVGTQPSRALHWYAGPDDAAPTRRTVRGIPVSGPIASDAAVADLACRLGGRWSPWPEIEVLDADGARSSSAWRNGEGGTILPFDPDRLIVDCRAERYRELRGGASRLHGVALHAYYRVRSLLPRRVQIELRRAFSRVQARSHVSAVAGRAGAARPL